MSDRLFLPARLSGRVTVPPSKSAGHRALICAALAGSCRVALAASSEDFSATLEVLRALGADCTADASGYRFAARTEPRSGTVDCRESGTTLRLLLPVAAALGARVTLTGSGRLPARPLGVLTDLLTAHGATCSSDRLPLTLSGRLQPGRYRLPGNISSQYVSGLLLAAPLTGGACEIELTTALESTGYVALTLDWMRRFGVLVEQTETGYRVPGGQSYRAPADEIAVEGDWSQAGFFLAAGALGGDLAVCGLDPVSLQGDRAAFSLFSAFGASLRWEDGALRVSPGALHGISIDASQIPDLVPPLAVTAAFARGKTLIHSAARLRLKESDRLQTVAAGLRAMGVEVAERPDGLTIVGGAPNGGVISGANDHRIVMAFSVAACFAAGETRITDAEAVAKSYPRFFEDLAALGGNSHAV